jgi:membrane-bound lytic murein transglycosylase A
MIFISGPSRWPGWKTGWTGFFLEIQGSGRIQTPENEIIRIQYAGANGNPYRSIGRYLIDKQEIARENMSMQAIRQWLEDNPHRMDEVLHYNDSFVFFQHRHRRAFRQHRCHT